MQQAEVMIECRRLGRDAALRVILISGVILSFKREMPHKGCRHPKKRRVYICVCISKFSSANLRILGDSIISHCKTKGGRTIIFQGYSRAFIMT
jgi:hypothetical protein